MDGLHSSAGSRKLTELHGCAKRVLCLDCGRRLDRAQVQGLIAGLNPHWTVAELGELAPDGDADIPERALASFRPPFCPQCGPGSVLKTDVVFFGENVPLALVRACYERVAEADCLLVVGSSLLVMSGFRFVHAAHQLGTPVLLLNIGPTRADPLASLKLPHRASDVLPLLQLGPTG